MPTTQSGVIASLLTGLVSGAITAIVTYYATVAKTRLDLSVDYDKDLRTKRLEAYKALWAKLKPLARYSLEHALTYQIALDTSAAMREWYFDVGGIFLSAESRHPYFELKGALEQIMDDKELQQKKDEALDKARAKRVQQAASVLRASLSNDIGTRRGPMLSGDESHY